MTTAERRITTTGAPDAEAGAESRVDRRTGPVGPTSVDPAHWPDIAAVPPASRLRTALTAALVRRALAQLPLRARFAGSPDLGKGGPLIDVRDPAAFHARIGTHGLVGFGESYMAGEWDAPI